MPRCQARRSRRCRYRSPRDRDVECPALGMRGPDSAWRASSVRHAQSGYPARCSTLRGTCHRRSGRAVTSNAVPRHRCPRRTTAARPVRRVKSRRPLGRHPRAARARQALRWWRLATPAWARTVLVARQYPAAALRSRVVPATRPCRPPTGSRRRCRKRSGAAPDVRGWSRHDSSFATAQLTSRPRVPSSTAHAVLRHGWWRPSPPWSARRHQ